MSTILFGFPACGKTTVGKRVAQQLDKTFVDLDYVIEAIYYDPIAGRSMELTCRQIAREHGEEYFRALEREAIKKLRLIRHGIIATGGGAVLDFYNHQELKKRGQLFYLLADKQQIKQRLFAQDSLPTYLDKGNPEDAFEEMYRTRQPVYERVADVVVDTRNRSLEQIAKEISDLLQK